MEILLGLILVVMLVAVLNYWDRSEKKPPKLEIRPSVFDGPDHPSVDERSPKSEPYRPKYKDPFTPKHPSPSEPRPMVPHDEAKDATGVSSGFGHDDYKAPKDDNAGWGS